MSWLSSANRLPLLLALMSVGPAAAQLPQMSSGGVPSLSAIK